MTVLFAAQVPIAQDGSRIPVPELGDSILDRIQRHARSRTAEPALLFPNEPANVDCATVSWGKLEDLVTRYGRLLTMQGATDGDLVVILTASVREQILGFLGAMAAGCTPTIVSYPSAKQSDVAFLGMIDRIIERARPRFILASHALARKVQNSCRKDQLLLFADSERLPVAGEMRVRSLEDTHFVQFSSGTTGLRKAVAVTGRMLLNQLEAYGRALDLRSDDRVISWLPLYHDMGLVASFLCSVWHGLTSVHASPFEWLMHPEALFKWICTYRGTLVWLPNFAYDLCADRIGAADIGSSAVSKSLRAFINCSEPVRQRSHERFLHAFHEIGVRVEHLQTCYAMAEATFAVTQSKLGMAATVDYIDRVQLAAAHCALPVDPLDRNALAIVSCGGVIDGTRVRIAGNVAERMIGEIEIASPSGFDGYGYADSHANTFTNDGWYKSGDLGYLAEGELYVTGRSKDLIIHRGQNIYPNDLEAALAEVPGTKPGRIVVFGVENVETSTEDIVVMLERVGPEVDRDSVVREVRQRLMDGTSHTPSDVVVCEPSTLLKSTSGKLSRSKNRELYVSEYRRTPEATAKDPVVAGTETERVLLDIWSRALGRSDVTPSARIFAELGADSLSAMRAVGEIARYFRVQVLPTDLLQEDSVSKQAAWLDSRKRVAAVAPPADPILVRLQDGTAPPLFLLHPAGGRALPYTTLLPHLSKNRPLYAFQSPELFSARPHLSVNEMTAEYLERLLQVQPCGPYLIGGWSFGGLLAHDLACRLEAAGHCVNQLVLFDTDPPLPYGTRMRRQLRHLLACRCIANGVAPYDVLAPKPISPTTRFLSVLPPNLERPEELAAVMRYVSPTRFARVDGRTATVAKLWSELLSFLRAESDPDEMRGFFMPHLDAPGLLRGARVLAKNRYLSWSHAPLVVYRGGVTIFGAADPGRLQAWSKYCARGVRVLDYPIRGGRVLPPHFAMFDANNVALFGAELNALLDAASKQDGGVENI